jgi:glycosyltransferase involved in cell wall biosynthesis
MKLVFTSYVSSPEYTDPQAWLKRIEGYTGILESLSKTNSVIAVERINYEGKLEQNGVIYYFTRLKKKISRFPRRLHSIIKKTAPDAVFINGFFPFQVLQLRFSLGKKIKIIILHRAEKPFTGLKKHLQKIADKYIHAYLFVSSEFGRQWEDAGNLSSSKVHEVMQASSVFHVADRQLSKNKLSITGSPIFLWVGRLDNNKDPLTAVKAFTDFLQYYPDAKLYMIYQSDELLPELMNLTGDSSNAIHLVGKVAHQELQLWYNSADFIISSSHYEGSGVAVCEAMSCGCIPVVTNIISFHKMTGKGKCGLLYEPANEKDLLANLLAAMRLNREEERVKVLEQYKNELSFDAIADKINLILEHTNTN